MWVSDSASFHPTCISTGADCCLSDSGGPSVTQPTTALRPRALALRFRRTMDDPPDPTLFFPSPVRARPRRIPNVSVREAPPRQPQLRLLGRASASTRYSTTEPAATVIIAAGRWLWRAPRALGNAPGRTQDVTLCSAIRWVGVPRPRCRARASDTQSQSSGCVMPQGSSPSRLRARSRSLFSRPLQKEGHVRTRKERFLRAEALPFAAPLLRR